MNEVTKIHLGRQAFTISVDAQKALRHYLDAIEKQVKDKSVVDEVELRMAELLDERGIKGDKVILLADVKYLKEQLGDPKDFDDDGATNNSGARSASDDKRFYRDIDNAMFAGVASGLAAYFGVSVIIVRLLFIVGTIAWGGGVVLYLALWLLTPEANSPSEKLRMAGRPVTVDALKDAMDRADVKAATHRAHEYVAKPIGNIVNTITKVIGVGLTLIGLSLLISLFLGTVYLSVHGNIIMDNLFPIGLKEHLLVYSAGFVAALMSIFVILLGMAMFRRKWPIHSWLTGVLIGLTVMGMVVGGALAGDAAPRVRDRYNAHFQTITKTVQPFSTIVESGPADVSTQISDKYYVTVKYYDQSDPSKVKIAVKNGVLNIDANQYQWDRNCSSLCIPNHFDLNITVYSPNPPQTINPAIEPPATIPARGSVFDIKQTYNN